MRFSYYFNFITPITEQRNNRKLFQRISIKFLIKNYCNFKARFHRSNFEKFYFTTVLKASTIISKNIANQFFLDGPAISRTRLFASINLVYDRSVCPAIFIRNSNSEYQHHKSQLLSKALSPGANICSSRIRENRKNVRLSE